MAQSQRPQAHRRERAGQSGTREPLAAGRRIGPGHARGPLRERACRVRSARARDPAPTGDRRDTQGRRSPAARRHSRIASWSPSRSSTRYRPGVSAVMRCDSLKTSVVDAGSSRPSPRAGTPVAERERRTRRHRRPRLPRPAVGEAAAASARSAQRRQDERGTPDVPESRMNRQGEREGGHRRCNSARTQDRQRRPPRRAREGWPHTAHSPMATTPASAPGPFVAAMRSGGV